MYPLNKIVPPIAYRRSTVCEKGINIPTIPVIPTARRPLVSRRSGREKKVLTQSDEAPKEPWT